MVYQIDGMDAVTACYRYAGAVGVAPHGLTLAELWQMHYGRERLLRSHAIWQGVAIFAEKLDVLSFVATGQSRGESKPRLSAEQQHRVAMIQGCWRRNLPEPDFASPTWEDDTFTAFERYDKEHAL